MIVHRLAMLCVVVAIGCDFNPPSHRAKSELKPAPPIADRQVAEAIAWLDSIPQLPQGEPPIDDINELREPWIKQGKQMYRLQHVLSHIMLDEKFDHLTRLSAATAIGLVGDEDVIDDLAEVLELDDVDMQMAAVDSLRVFRSQKAIDPLARALPSTLRPEKMPGGLPQFMSRKGMLRSQILVALSEIGGAKAERILEEEGVVDVSSIGFRPPSGDEDRTGK